MKAKQKYHMLRIKQEDWDVLENLALHLITEHQLMLSTTQIALYLLGNPTLTESDELELIKHFKSS